MKNKEVMIEKSRKIQPPSARNHREKNSLNPILSYLKKILYLASMNARKL